MLGSPKARDLWDEFYTYVTETAGLSKTVALEAVSRRLPLVVLAPVQDWSGPKLVGELAPMARQGVLLAAVQSFI